MNNSLNYQHWAQYGGQNGALGWPITPEVCARDNSSCTVSFTGGVLGWTPSTGVHSIVGTRASEYLAQGGPGSRIGHPTGPAEWVTANGGGWVQRFSGGRVHAAGNGPGFWFNPDSLIGREYDRLGAGAGALGWPTGLEQCRDDGCFAEFQRGVITWSSTRGVQTFSGETGAAYLRGGGPRGELGLPLAAPSAVSGGTVLSLRGGAIYARSGASAFFATAASMVHARYASLGGATGSLGWPVSDEDCASGICETRYQSGSIVWTRASGAVAVLGALDERYREAGGPRGKLGPRLPMLVRAPPTEEAACRRSGTASRLRQVRDRPTPTLTA
ncbi:LGFP repeat-containing protein [Arenivirga flava]